MPLSERVPVLENMGFRVVDERTYHIRPQRDDEVLVPRHDCSKARRRAPVDLDALKDRLQDCFLAVMGGQAENDGYNALVLAAGLSGAMSRCMRTLSRFLRQMRVPFSQDYMWATLRKHSPHRRADREPVPRPFRSAAGSRAAQRARARGRDRRRDRSRACRPSKASTRTASSAVSSTR